MSPLCVHSPCVFVCVLIYFIFTSSIVHLLPFFHLLLNLEERCVHTHVYTCVCVCMCVCVCVCVEQQDSSLSSLGIKCVRRDKDNTQTLCWIRHFILLPFNTHTHTHTCTHTHLDTMDFSTAHMKTHKYIHTF